MTNYTELYDEILLYIQVEERYPFLTKTEKVSLALDCVYEVMIQGKSWKDLLEDCISHLWVKKKYEISSYFEETSKSCTWDRTKKLDYEDIIYECLETFGERITSFVLYILSYSKDYESVFSEAGLTRVEKFVILSVVQQLRGGLLLNKNTQDLPELNFNTTVDRAKFLAFLESYNPDLLVCLLLLHNQADFFQFLVLFGGKSFKVPTLSKFMEEVKSYNTKTESGSISKHFIQNVRDEDRTIADGLAGFLEGGYNILLQKYEQFLDELIAKADPKNPESLVNIYEFFHTEMNAQAQLVGKSAEYGAKLDTLKSIAKQRS